MVNSTKSDVSAHIFLEKNKDLASFGLSAG